MKTHSEKLTIKPKQCCKGMDLRMAACIVVQSGVTELHNLVKDAALQYRVCIVAMGLTLVRSHDDELRQLPHSGPIKRM